MPDTNVELYNQIRLRPVVPRPFVATGSDFVLVSRPCMLAGWSFRETTGAATATAELYDGSNTTGRVAAEQQVASGGTASQMIFSDGLFCEGGVFMHFVSGSLVGCIYVRV